MNKKFMIGGCAVAVVAGSMFAADEDISYFNPYASLKGGYAFLGKRNDIKYKGGFAGAVELGVSYDAWRLGLELGYKSNKIKEVSNGINGNWVLTGKIQTEVPAAGLNTIADTKGYSLFRSQNNTTGVVNNQWGLKNAMRLSKINALTGMMNVCYDYAVTEAWSIYAGVGLGAARVNVTVARRDSGVTTGAKKIGAEKAYNAAAYTVAEAKAAVLAALPKFFDGNNAKWRKAELSKTVFAWQLMAGVGDEFNENWKLTLGYKLFNTAKVKLGDTKIKMPFNHTAEVGLTYTF